MTSIQHKILIFIVAYNAESTIRCVLNRLPDSIFTNPKLLVEILAIDDCSKDQTVQELHEYKRLNTQVPLTILCNPVNLGYGGNQKLGYEYAINLGFDFVVLLHGDGQYAPEEVPKLLEPLLTDNADVVFGSRMLEAGRALQGGMPLYKYIGNKILTKLENLIIGTKLSEYHSGYRLYSTKILRSIPLALNSNDFDFDTDIIIQLHLCKARIKEISIPSFYGDEICHVNGIKYAFNIILSCIESRLQKFALFYNPKFDFSIDNKHYESKFNFDSSHSRSLKKLDGGENILALGSGPIDLIKPFIDKGTDVSIIDQYIDSQCNTTCKESLEMDLNSLNLDLLKSKEPFNLVLALDIIEHLQSPETLLQKLKDDLRFANSKIIITTPNIAFITVRIALLFGQFNYGKRGILDLTHTRLFTFRSIKKLLNQAGYKLISIQGIPVPFPLVIGDNWLSKLLLQLNTALISIAPSIFSFQIMCEAQIGSSARVLLQLAKKDIQT